MNTQVHQEQQTNKIKTENYNSFEDNIKITVKNENCNNHKNNIIKKRPIFTKQMKKDYKILIPNMLPVHFNIIAQIFINEGYDVELLKNKDNDVVTQGLKYVHNDTCYPALLVIGQMISALNSGNYDTNKTALLITQTGGGCRASNYIHLLRKALKKAGYSHIPVISLNMSGLEKNPGFKLSFRMIRKGIAGLISGDVIMHISNQVRPYEITKGETDNLIKKWTDNLTKQFNQGKGYKIKPLMENINSIIEDFSKIAIKKEPKVKVGIVGEIYVKYSPLANNDLEKFLASQDCEVCVPGVMAFMLYMTDNIIIDTDLYGGNVFIYHAMKILKKYFSSIEKKMLKVYENYSNFSAPTPFEETKKMVDGVIGYGTKMGEGWLLTAEMLELAHTGYENIICAQPFGCLPNHIVGRGMIRKIREKCPNANIVAVDYDPGATKVNQENRIKLMLAVGKENLQNYEISIKNESIKYTQTTK